MIFLHMVANEVTKMLRKRRFQVVLIILFVLMGVFAYGEKQAANTLTRQLGTTDWHVQLQKEITSDTNHLQSPFITGAEKAGIKAEITEGQFELVHNINPYAPGAPSFMRGFMDEGILLLIPMLVVVVASDMVSSEMSGGTIKVLLTRGVSRFKLLASKLAALVLLIGLRFVAIAISSYVVSGIFYGYEGWRLPVLMGFQTSSTGYVNVGHVYTIPQWQYLFMDFGLGFFVSVCIACLSFMVSTLVRSTASSMGIMMAALISGTLLSVMATSWTTAKYLPIVNLQLSNYLNGSPPPIAGMTFPFSLTILTVWSLVALAISFTVFIRKDVL